MGTLLPPTASIPPGVGSPPPFPKKCPPLLGGRSSEKKYKVRGELLYVKKSIQ